jgi:hypothetical protein
LSFNEREDFRRADGAGDDFLTDTPRTFHGHILDVYILVIFFIIYEYSFLLFAPEGARLVRAFQVRHLIISMSNIEFGLRCETLT